MPLMALRPMLVGAITFALALLLGLTPSGADALGLGRPQVHSALGRPLDVSLPLTLAAGEQLTDACVRVEVSTGDARVPAGLLQLRIEGESGQQRIRVQSVVRIDEPALRMTLALGCPLQLTREFYAFVDPAESAPATPPAAAPAPLPALQPAPPPAPAAPDVPASALEPPRPDAEARPARTPKAAPLRLRAKPRPSVPRLMLERPEVLVADAPRPVQPASAAEAQQTADAQQTAELDAQITQLEQTVAQLRAEFEARLQAEAAAAPAVLPAAPAQPVAPAQAPASARSPSPYRDPMTWVLTLGLSLLAGSAAFYASRWRDERTRRERAYWRALHAAEGGVAPEAPPPPSPGMAPPVGGEPAWLPKEGQHHTTRPQPKPMQGPSAQVGSFVAPNSDDLSERAASAAAAADATQRLTVQPPAAPALLQELTVADELLDLQQQVEFLQLLGQHEAAADLLATRIVRGNCGAMPYLVLMEICQQRSEPDVFAELVKQFEQRFVTLAPQWSKSVSRGRGLDATPGVMAPLQDAWSDPTAAMQMLRDLLSRGAGPGAASFDLPAYRDLLTLYGVARDLFEAGLRGDDVDVMLPIDSKFGAQ